ncbi:D-2-hydroxyacid dehydrogenase, partial [Streptomyces sp. NPDC001273]
MAEPSGARLGHRAVPALDADPLPRLGRLTGRVRVEHADASTLAERLP